MRTYFPDGFPVLHSGYEAPAQGVAVGGQCRLSETNKEQCSLFSHIIYGQFLLCWKGSISSGYGA